MKQLGTQTQKVELRRKGGKKSGKKEGKERKEEKRRKEGRKEDGTIWRAREEESGKKG